MNCSPIQSRESLSNCFKKPEVSVITVCRNSSDTIAKTFDSVLDQQFADMEYIVIDGASTDGTLSIIDDYRDRFTGRGIRMHLTSEPDQGIYDAMNKGIMASRGSLIAILNSDDKYEPNALDKMHQAASDHQEVGIFYVFIRQFYNSQELVVHRYNYDCILTDLSAGIHSAAQHPTCFIRRSVYEEIGAYDPSYKLAADYDFLLRAKKYGICFFPVDQVIASFALGGATDTTPMQVRLKERYRAQFTNGLIDKYYYHKQLRNLRSSPYQKMKKALKTYISIIQK